MQKRPKVLACTIKLVGLSALLALLVILWFQPGTSGVFLLDDGFNILRNHMLYVESLTLDSLIEVSLSFHHGGGNRALPMASFALDYWRSASMDPAAFKQTNILIHGCTVFLLVLFLRRLFLLNGWNEVRALHMACLVAALWALHPMQASSVLYVVQRMQTMATLFLVAALWAYLAMRQTQINGKRGRLQGVLVVVCWLLALLCKEDAVLLVAYTLVLEWTILRFQASQAVVARGLRQSYLLIGGLGLLVYIFYVLPHYWQWAAYPGRDFSTPERLLTQGRVLVMHIGQILLPWPDWLYFMYDWYVPSRSFLEPWTTLPALVIVLGLLLWAWRWRSYRPLFSCGVLLFFAGHFITSNVIGLELVFEHRNHFPLLGVLLALVDVFLLVSQKYAAGRKGLSFLAGGCLLLVGVASAAHIQTWSDAERHGRKLVEIAPDSGRAWLQYSDVYFKRYSQEKNEQDLTRAAEISEQALQHVSSPVLAVNIIIYHSILGQVDEKDWAKLYQELEVASTHESNRRAVWLLMENARRGYPINLQNTIKAFELLDIKTPFSSRHAQEIAVFAYKEGLHEASLNWFLRFVQRAKSSDPAVARMISELQAAGHTDWVEQLNKIVKRNGEP